MSVIELRCRARRGGFNLDVDLRLGHAATGVFGPSGAGKTTLLHALAGLQPADELRLVVDGAAIVDTAACLVPPAHRRRVGLVFQDHRLFPHRSVEANLRYGATSASSGGPAFDEVVGLLELEDLLPRRPDACSGGQRQRVALGRALLGGPRFLLLDEPLASLDRGLRRQILPFLRRVRERFDLPMLVVSHDLADLFALTDELVLVDRGRAVGQGTLSELAASSDTLELLHDCGLVFALPGRVARRDDDGLTWVALDGVAGTSGREIACGDSHAAVGTSVEVVLRPDDVVLAIPPLEARLSFTNAFEGTVTRITRTAARCLVTLDCGFAVPVLAEVTGRAVRSLGLAPGVPVLALCKAQATRARGLEAEPGAPELEE